MNRTIEKQIQGYPTIDGAGVHLVRVLGNQTVKEFDPILMLDSFDSSKPEEYIAGFPMHPHRGIETISYVSRGNMMHRDSLGNEDTIHDGEVQWMTAGSGILHEERIPATERLLGAQLWLNLPASEKMTSPTYRSIKKDEIPEIPFDGGYLRLLAGSYKNHQGYIGKHLPLDYYDIHLQNNGKGNAEIRLETNPTDSIMLFTLVGEIEVEGQRIPEKTAVKLTAGDLVHIKNTNRDDTQVLYIASKALHEPIAWAGPIVMNTEDELRQAFSELRENRFLQEKVDY